MSHPREVCAASLRALAAWAASTRLDGIPPFVLCKAARLVADDLAVIIGARNEPEVMLFHQRLMERAGVPEATVWRGGGARTDRYRAAVANAVAGDWLELDEGYRRTPCHAGLYVLPALLAHAEPNRLRWGDVLRALVLAYEIVTRIGLAWKQQRLTMQAHGRYGAVGAAAGIGVAERLSADQLACAIGAAATLIGPAPRSHLEEGVLIRNVWPASAAWNGMMAVEWGRCGIVGTPVALHDVYGTVLDGEPHLEQLVKQLGERWSVQDSYTKIYACCQHLHSAVEAAGELRSCHEELGAAEKIASISVQCHPSALTLADASPQTTLGAKFSMPHAIAATLVMGEAGAAAFAADSLRDDAIARLRRLVTIERWTGDLTPPNDRPARVTVTTRSGREFRAECLSAQGGPDRPLPEDTWIQKMRTLAEPAYPGIVDVFEQLVLCDQRSLAREWPEIVREACARADAGAS